MRAALNRVFLAPVAGRISDRSMMAMSLSQRLVAAWGTAVAGGLVVGGLGSGAVAAAAGGHTIFAGVLVGGAALASLGLHLLSTWSLAQPWQALPQAVGRLLRQETPAAMPLLQRIRLTEMHGDPIQAFAAHISRTTARLSTLAPRLEAASRHLGELGQQACEDAASMAAAARQAEACLQRAHQASPALPAAVVRGPLQPDMAQLETALSEQAAHLDVLERSWPRALPAAPSQAPVAGAPGLPSAAGASGLQVVQIVQRGQAVADRQAQVLGELSLPVGAVAAALNDLQGCLAEVHALRQGVQAPQVTQLAALGGLLAACLNAGRAASEAMRRALAEAASEVAALRHALALDLARSGQPAGLEADAEPRLATPQEEADAEPVPPAWLLILRQHHREVQVSAARLSRSRAVVDANIRPPRSSSGLTGEMQQARQHVSTLLATQETTRGRTQQIAQAMAALGALKGEVEAIVVPPPMAKHAPAGRRSGRPRSLFGGGGHPRRA